MRIKEHPVLDFNEDKKKYVNFTFNGKSYKGIEGEPISSALHANGIRILRKTAKLERERGIFCAIGKCSSCIMNVNGIPNVKTCVEPLKEGTVVRSQNKKGDLSGGQHEKI